jgi:hypothetical protein
VRLAIGKAENNLPEHWAPSVIVAVRRRKSMDDPKAANDATRPREYG